MVSACLNLSLVVAIKFSYIGILLAFEVFYLVVIYSSENER